MVKGREHSAQLNRVLDFQSSQALYRLPPHIWICIVQGLQQRAHHCLVAHPYLAHRWAERGPSTMRVWLPEQRG